MKKIYLYTKHFTKSDSSATQTNVVSRLIKQLLLSLFLLIMVQGTAWGQITSLKTWTNVYHGTATTAQSITYTVPSGSDTYRMLVVGIASSITAAGTSTVTLTYGGQTFTASVGDITVSGLQHTQLYYFNEAKLDLVANSTLSVRVQVSTGTPSMTDVFASVFDGVDQTNPITNSQNYNSGSTAVDPFQYGTALTVNANDQAVEIISLVRTGSTTQRTISSYATNWANIGGEQTGLYNTTPNANDQAIRNAVANRSIPAANTTDVSSINISGSARASMTGLSLKMAVIPKDISFSPSFACSGSGQSVVITGNNFTGATSVSFNGTASAFTVNSATQITATLPAGATTGTISITAPGGTGISAGTFTVNPLPIISTQPASTTICIGSSANLAVASSSNSPIYQWQSATNAGGPWSYITSQFNTNPVFFESDFTSLPSNTNIYGSASITGGALQLTPATSSLTGGFVIQSTPSTNLTAFNVNFDYQIWDGNGADGLSLSYGPNIANNAGPGEEGEDSGIIVKFDTYDNVTGTNTNSQIRVNYNGTQIWTNTLGSFNLRNINYRNVNLYVDHSGNLSLSIGGVSIISDLAISAYALANKSTWKFKFSGRTGGQNDSHRIDNLKIQYGDNPTLPISPTATTYYRAIVNSGLCPATSNQATITVEKQPVITGGAGPTTQTVCQNATAATLSVTAAGAGILNYYLYSNTTNSNTGGTLVGSSTTPTFTPPTSTVGTVYYYVIVTGTCGSVTSDVSTVIVTASTAIITQPVSPQAVCKNAPATPLSVSATGTGTLTYQWYSNLINNNATGTLISSATSSTYTPPTTAAGTTYYYVIVTGCNSVASSVSKVDVTACNNYWKGETSTNWELPGNWTANYVPLTGDNVEFATEANNPTVTGDLKSGTAKNDLVVPINVPKVIGTLTNASAKNLIVPANASLTVNGVITIMNPGTAINSIDPRRILIKAAPETPNGTLIFNNPQNSPVYGSVEFYSKASWDKTKLINSGEIYNWQYFGSPVKAVRASPTFDGAYVRKKLEQGTTTANHWEQLSNNSSLEPFIGYEICQQNPTTYTIEGNLVNSDFQSGQLSKTPGALFPGQHLFTNPYTAAINIKQLSFGDDMEATVYLYNTGSFGEWGRNEISLTESTVPGQYMAVPLSLAGDFGIPEQVPSMGTMLVRILSPTTTSEAFLNFSYSSVVMPNNLPMRSKETTQQEAKPKILTTIEVHGEKSSDKMWLFYDDNSTRGFNNGYDGKKILGSALNCQIFAVERDENYQINSIPDVDNTVLAFQAGADKVFTLTFNHKNLQNRYSNLYLYDTVEDKIVEITENGSTYTFAAISTPKPVQRFKLFSKNEAEVNASNSKITYFIDNNVIRLMNFSNEKGRVQLFDISGRLISNSTIAPFGFDLITVQSQHIYLLNITVEGETTVNKLIVR